MKRYISSLVAIIFIAAGAVVLVPSGAAHAQDPDPNQVITVEDEHLAHEVGATNGKITVGKLQAMEHFDYGVSCDRGEKWADVRPVMKYMTSLKEIEFHMGECPNDRIDLSVLEEFKDNLQQVERFDLEDIVAKTISVNGSQQHVNALKYYDWSPISNLSNLKVASLTTGGDVGKLDGLPKLERLYAGSYQGDGAGIFASPGSWAEMRVFTTVTSKDLKKFPKLMTSEVVSSIPMEGTLCDLFDLKIGDRTTLRKYDWVDGNRFLFTNFVKTDEYGVFALPPHDKFNIHFEPYDTEPQTATNPSMGWAYREPSLPEGYYRHRIDVLGGSYNNLVDENGGLLKPGLGFYYFIGWDPDTTPNPPGSKWGATATFNYFAEIPKGTKVVGDLPDDYTPPPLPDWMSCKAMEVAVDEESEELTYDESDPVVDVDPMDDDTVSGNVTDDPYGGKTPDDPSVEVTYTDKTGEEKTVDVPVDCSTNTQGQKECTFNKDIPDADKTKPITVTVKDPSGNQTTVDVDVVDNIAPVVMPDLLTSNTVTGRVSDAANGGITPGDPSVTVNYKRKDATRDMTRSGNDGSVDATLQCSTNQTTKAKECSFSADLPEDADKLKPILVRAIDPAGNSGEAFVPLPMTALSPATVAMKASTPTTPVTQPKVVSAKLSTTGTSATALLVIAVLASATGALIVSRRRMVA